MGEIGDLVEGAACRRLARARDGDRADAETDAAAVDDADRDDIGDRTGGEFRALHRGRQRARERHDDDARRALVVQLAVDRFELTRRGRGSLWQRGAARAAPPELAGRQLLTVEELLLTEPDRE